MQMKKEYAEPGEYDFFPETYMLPQEMNEFKKQYQMCQWKAQENPEGLNEAQGELNGNQLKDQGSDKNYMRQTGRYKQNSM